MGQSVKRPGQSGVRGARSGSHCAGSSFEPPGRADCRQVFHPGGSNLIRSRTHVHEYSMDIPLTRQYPARQSSGLRICRDRTGRSEPISNPCEFGFGQAHGRHKFRSHRRSQAVSSANPASDTRRNLNSRKQSVLPIPQSEAKFVQSMTSFLIPWSKGNPVPVNTTQAQRVRVIDSHTGGEPTRLVVSGGPDLGKGSLAERLRRFCAEHDRFRSAVVNEPRGSDVIVGALLCEPVDRSLCCRRHLLQ